MILNRSYLSNAASLSHMDSLSSRQHVFSENKQLYFSKNSFDLFLSHSYLDKSLVYTIVDLFNDAGYSVYVDWMIDTQLDRSQINVGTAETLRNRMDTCCGLAYIATSNTSKSKWCPWELGYMDGKKNNRCAILPVLESSASTFSGQEYLGMYPYVDYEKNDKGIYEFWVNDPSVPKKYVALSEWLNGQNLRIHE